MARASEAVLLSTLMLMSGLAGCFGTGEGGDISPSSLSISDSDSLAAGTWQEITISAEQDISVFIPYFLIDPGSGRAQNGTVFDIKSGNEISMDILFPPRNGDIIFQIGDYGRTN